MAAEQRIIRFIGRVQGVGFRWTTCRVAEGYDVVGAVRNCSDGSVECVAEGTPAEIDAFIQELSGRMTGHIRDVQQQTAPASGTFDGFSVRF